MKTNKKRIGLSLEFETYDMLGVKNAPMKFNEQSIATCIRMIADQQENMTFGIYLLALAISLESPEAIWKLRIFQGIQGKMESPYERIRRIKLNRQIADFVRKSVAEGSPHKAAVADAQIAFGYGRDKIYRALKDVRAGEEQTAAMKKMAVKNAEQEFPQFDKSTIVAMIDRSFDSILQSDISGE